jgi:alkaline phosphatase D
MTRLALLVCLAAVMVRPGLAAEPADLVHRAPAPDAVLTRIAVGSCLNQRRPAPILRTIAGLRPDLLLLIGDNVYADTDDAARMRAAYADLGANADYRALVGAVPVLATWDDHDYGDNDAGAEWAFQHGAKDAMLAFFDEPAGSPRRSRDGVYDARVFGPPGRRVQVILLDTRWFRSPLVQAERGYTPNTDPRATILGDAQWAWLGAQLRVPAEVRILASSIQVVANDHAFERWGNFPAERARLLRTLADTGAHGLVVVSGDRHRGELSILNDPALGFPLYDLTTSSLNVPIPREEPNRLRHGPLVTDANFGLVEIDWTATPPALTLSLRDIDGKPVVQERVPLDRLQSRPGG